MFGIHYKCSLKAIPVSLYLITNIEINVYNYICIGLSHWDFSSLGLSYNLSKSLRRYCRSISIVHDHVHEEDEKFHVLLNRSSTLPGYVRIAPAKVTIIIINVKREFAHSSIICGLYKYCLD